MEVLKNPKSKEQAERTVEITQNRFGAGTFFDSPANTIPDNSLYEAYDVKVYNEWIEGRTGTKEWSDTSFPMLPGRQNYIFTKTGFIVTLVAGSPNFVADDYGSWIIWPDGVHELIVEYLTPTTVRVNSDATHVAPTVANPAKMRGQVNGMCWHESSAKIILFIDTRFFYSDWQISSWTEIYRRCRDVPRNEIGDMISKKGDYLYVFNSFGIFCIDMGVAVPEFWKKNVETLYSTMAPVAETETLKYGRRYLVGNGIRISGTGYRDRATAGTTIKQEGGVFRQDPLRSNLDYTEVFTENKPSTNGSYQELVCGTSICSIANWKLAGANPMAFRVTVNGYGANIVIDCTGITSVSDIAALINAQFAANFATSTCRCWVDTTLNIFHFTAGTTNGSTISNLGFHAVLTAMGYNDISGAPYLNGHAPAPIFNRQISNTVGPVAVNAYTLPTSTEEQFTHYPVYATKDTGAYPELKTGDRSSNPNLNLYIWDSDVPICKGMTVARDITGLITAAANGGYFEAYDVGAVITFADGVSDTIVSLQGVPITVNGFLLYPQAQGTAGVKLTQGASIGASKRFRCSQTGTLVNKTTILEPGVFAAGDVGRTIHWAGYEYSYIVEFISPQQVRVSEGANRTDRGIAMIPSSRYFNDGIPDETLQARVKSYSLGHRLWRELPVCNCGIVVPGFIFSAVRGQHTICYSQIPVGKEYLGGYFNPAIQYEILNNAIECFREFVDLCVIFCQTAIKRIGLNAVIPVQVPEIGETVSQITGITDVDTEIGCLDFGSIQYIGESTLVFATSEPGIRTFNGYQLSKNLLITETGMKLIRDKFQKLQPALASMYCPIEGYVLWGSETAQ